MNKTFIAACCALASFQSFAGDWTPAGRMQNQVQFVDYSSIQKSGDIRGTWMLCIFNNDKNGDAYSLVWVDFDCKNKKIRESDYTYYDIAGNVNAAGKWNVNWSRAFPGSIGETACTTVCQQDSLVLFKDKTPHWVAKTVREAMTQNGEW